MLTREIRLKNRPKGMPRADDFAAFKYRSLRWFVTLELT